MFQAVNQRILTYYHNTQHVGSLPDGKTTFQAISGVRGQGDVMQVYLELDDSLSQIITARFQVYGSLFAIASCAFLMEAVQNNSVAFAKTITSDQIVESLSLPKTRIHCAFRAIDVLSACLAKC